MRWEERAQLQCLELIRIVCAEDPKLPRVLARELHETKQILGAYPAVQIHQTLEQAEQRGCRIAEELIAVEVGVPGVQQGAVLTLHGDRCVLSTEVDAIRPDDDPEDTYGVSPKTRIV